MNQFETNLAAKRIDPRDFHAHVVAQAEFLAVAAVFDQLFFFVVVVIVVDERVFLVSIVLYAVQSLTGKPSIC